MSKSKPGLKRQATIGTKSLQDREIRMVNPTETMVREPSEFVGLDSRVQNEEALKIR
jgi:hypothetical protein